MIGSLAWVFFATQVAGLVLSAIYFAAPPAICSALVAACLGWAAVLVTRSGVTTIGWGAPSPQPSPAAAGEGEGSTRQTAQWLAT